MATNINSHKQTYRSHGKDPRATVDMLSLQTQRSVNSSKMKAWIMQLICTEISIVLSFG